MTGKKFIGIKNNRFVVDNKVVLLAQRKLAIQALTNSNEFVPFGDGITRKSGETIEGGVLKDSSNIINDNTLKWSTAYARRLYYGENFNFNKRHNKNATHHWFEAAKKKYLRFWKQIASSGLMGK